MDDPKSCVQRTTPKAVCSQRTTPKAMFTQPMDDPKSCIDAVSRRFQKLRSVSGRPQRLCSRSQWTIPNAVSTQSMDDPKGCVQAVSGRFQRLCSVSWTTKDSSKFDRLLSLFGELPQCSARSHHANIEATGNLFSKPFTRPVSANQSVTNAVHSNSSKSAWSPYFPN